MIATFIVKADVTKLAEDAMATEDNIIDTITDVLTIETGKFGTECWLDDVTTERD